MMLTPWDELETREDGRLFVGDACTLDGRPARILGRSLPWAIVCTPGDELGELLEVQFAWPTVAHVMRNKGGAFRS